MSSWLNQRAGPLLLLRYEQMLANPTGETARLANFLGLAADQEAIDRAVGCCRFETLQAAEAADGFAERIDHMERFFRQGRAGAWRSALTPEQVARIEADHGAVMARLGYDCGSSTG